MRLHVRGILSHTPNRNLPQRYRAGLPRDDAGGTSMMQGHQGCNLVLHQDGIGRRHDSCRYFAQERLVLPASAAYAISYEGWSVVAVSPPMGTLAYLVEFPGVRKLRTTW